MVKIYKDRDEVDTSFSSTSFEQSEPVIQEALTIELMLNDIPK
jgi:hypothetical protein